MGISLQVNWCVSVCLCIVHRHTCTGRLIMAVAENDQSVSQWEEVITQSITHRGNDAIVTCLKS